MIFGSNYTKRIRETFCAECKYRRQATDEGCPKFLYIDGVCAQFEWSSKDRKQQYQDEVLDNQAATIWLSRGIKLEEVQKMKRQELRAVLTKKHYEQFSEFDASLLQLKEQKLREQQNAALTERKTTRKKVSNEITQEEVQKRLREKEAAKNEVVNKADTLDSALKKDTPKATEQILENTISKQVEHKDVFPRKRIAPQHYFYCKKPDGKKVTYRRDTSTKTYEDEVKYFRKYLEKQNIIILTEEIK